MQSAESNLNLPGTFVRCFLGFSFSSRFSSGRHGASSRGAAWVNNWVELPGFWTISDRSVQSL